MLTKEIIEAASKYAQDPQNNNYDRNTSEWDVQEFELRYAFLAGAKWAAQGNKVYKEDRQ